MPIPDYQSLMLPVLTLAAQGETRVPLAAETIADQLNLSLDERDELLPSGKQRVLHNRIHWAKFYMTKAGLIRSPKRGVFVTSETGEALLKTRPDKIDVETLKAYPSFSEFINASTDGSQKEPVPEISKLPSSTATPEEQIDAAQAVLVGALQSDLIAQILDLSPAFFERLIVDLLVAMGYGGSHENAARQLGKSGDGGIDGIIDEDRLGLSQIYVQAKRYAASTSIGRPDVQGFVGSLVGNGAMKGVFVTTSSYSKHAIDYVAGLQQRVILIDGKRLSELMIEFGVGVRLNRTVHVMRIDEDYFSDVS